MADRLDEIRNICIKCHRCDLGDTRKHVVFGSGSDRARVMFVGEGPGEQEDKTGEPFVGRAGQLLDKMLAAIDLPRDQVYITNIVKCRPPGNRDPREDESESCIPYLREQFAIIRPRIVVCLGRVASMRLIAPDFKVTKQHGSFHDKKGTLFMGTFHPAALLRNPQQMPSCSDDFFALRDKIREICPEVYE